MNWRSLHVKLAITVSAGALLVVAASGYVFYQRSYALSLEHNQRAVQQLLETVATTAAIAAYVSNKELAQEVASGLGQNSIVKAVEIDNGSGRIAKVGSPLPDADWVRLPLHAPFSEEEIAGELRVQADQPLIAERARASALGNTALLTGQMLAVAVLVLMTVYWMLSRPLTYLSRRLHEIMPGESERLRISKRHAGDEIGVLVDDINGLLNTVEHMLSKERELRKQVEALEQRFRSIFEDSSAGIFLLNHEGQLLTANPAFFRLTGLSAQQQSQLASQDALPAIFLDADEARSLLHQAITSQRPCAADLRFAQVMDAPERWSHCIFSTDSDGDNANTIEGVLYDITVRKQAEETTREQAERDGLTGLLNRHAADLKCLELAQQAQHLGCGFVVMMLDLDRFKYINDTYGHDAGDEVLRTVAGRLRAAVRDSDIVARLGGDEFLLLLPQTEHLDAARRIAGKLVKHISEPIPLNASASERVGVSIGIAAYPRHGRDVHLVRKHADAAMYEVKRQGRNGFAIRTDDGDHESQLFGIVVS